MREGSQLRGERHELGVELVGNDKRAIFTTYLSSKKSFAWTVTYKYVSLKCISSYQSQGHAEGGP